MALVPAGVVTVTSTVPAASAGAMAVIDVGEEKLKLVLVMAMGPKLTTLAPVKLVPVMVTDAPPVVGPVAGLTRVTVGAAS